MDCSHDNDFDVYSTQSIFFFYPESCARLEYGGQQEEISCYGATTDPHSAVFSSDSLIECYVDFYSPHLPYVRTGTFCMGQYCGIAASPQGEIYRGCVTLDQTNAVHPMGPGYFKSYTGMEQWLCDHERCNYDLETTENSWPEELEQYRFRRVALTFYPWWNC
uniref:Leishmanolysin-like peptidase n=1 Tax=Heterorhabditis bacteriophora TaxID=37862 RepID=A0A1I7XDF9_HETBA